MATFKLQTRIRWAYNGYMGDKKRIVKVGFLVAFLLAALLIVYFSFFSNPDKSTTASAYLSSVFTSIFGVVSDTTVVMPPKVIVPTSASAVNNLTGVDAFAQCLTGQGLKMYGIPPCPSCAEQKRLFGSSFRYITYIDCESQKETCQQKNIRGYPTWEFGDGRMISGIVPLEYFSKETGCRSN